MRYLAGGGRMQETWSGQRRERLIFIMVGERSPITPIPPRTG
jgi:hypothetical protein